MRMSRDRVGEILADIWKVIVIAAIIVYVVVGCLNTNNRERNSPFDNRDLQELELDY